MDAPEKPPKSVAQEMFDTLNEIGELMEQGTVHVLKMESGTVDLSATMILITKVHKIVTRAQLSGLRKS